MCPANKFYKAGKIVEYKFELQYIRLKNKLKSFKKLKI